MSAQRRRTRRNPSVNPWALAAVFGTITVLGAAATWSLFERKFRKRNCPTDDVLLVRDLLLYVVDLGSQQLLTTDQIASLRNGDMVTMVVETTQGHPHYVDVQVEWNDQQLADGTWRSSLETPYPCPLPKNTLRLGPLFPAHGEDRQPTAADARRWRAQQRAGERQIFPYGFRGPLVDPSWPSDLL
jgi:hypothetical protein